MSLVYAIRHIFCSKWAINWSTQQCNGLSSFWCMYKRGIKTRPLLCSRRPFSLFNSFYLTDSFLQFLSFDLNFDRLALAAGEKVAKQVSSLSPALSAQFYRLTRKPGVEEVSSQIKDHFMEEEEKYQDYFTMFSWLPSWNKLQEQTPTKDKLQIRWALQLFFNPSLRWY